MEESRKKEGRKEEKRKEEKCKEERCLQIKETASEVCRREEAAACGELICVDNMHLRIIQIHPRLQEEEEEEGARERQRIAETLCMIFQKYG